VPNRFLNPYIEKIKDFSGVVFFGEECKTLLDGLNHPVFLDIGCGNGENLVQQATENPQNYYIGVELQYKEVYRTALKIQRKGLNNCKVFQMDAKKLPELFKDKRIAGVNILFPDPWPKAKQKKNRLINNDYMKALFSKSIDGAIFKFRTDNDDYFLDMLRTIYSMRDDHSIDIKELSRDIYNKVKIEHKDITAFERIFIKQGFLINALYFIFNKSIKKYD